MTEFYRDDHVTLLHGHALDMLKTLPDRSVDCCVTSPPYYGLRDYGEPGQYGLEKSPAEYVANMRALFAEVRRVLADDGVLWLNLGDSYAANTRSDNRTAEQRSSSSTLGPKRDGLGGQNAAHKSVSFTPRRMAMDVGPKNLLGIPWRTAFALQDDGWILRNDIIWSKPNAMPESVTDRLSTRHELIFLFSKKRSYWFDLDPIREPLQHPDTTGHTFGGNHTDISNTRGGIYKPRGTHEVGRNPGDVWTIPTQPFPGAHFAVFPVEIPRRCIAAGCAPKVCRECGHKPPMLTKRRDARLDCGHNAYDAGTVLDPFSGSGTTGLAAGQLGRKYIGIDLSRKYLELSLQTRLAQTALIDGGAA